MKKLVKMVKLNNVQYNLNRDVEVYRRPVGHPFQVQVWLGGSGEARARFEVDGRSCCEQRVTLPGRFECEVSFDTPGVRIGTVCIEADGETFRQDLRLDVLEHAWVG